MAEKPKSEKWKGARTRNLTAAQQKQAKRIVGGGRSEKVTAAERKASQAKVDIGQTKWVTAKERGGAGRGGLLTDTSGKAVTGTVTLPSGKTATYVRGKRIGVTGGSTGAGRGGAGTGRGGAGTGAGKGGAGTGAGRGGNGGGNSKPTPSRMSPGSVANKLSGMDRTGTAASKPKAGDKYVRIVNGRPTPMVWTGSRWVLATSYKGKTNPGPYKKGYTGGSWEREKSKNAAQKRNPFGTISHTGKNTTK